MRDPLPQGGLRVLPVQGHADAAGCVPIVIGDKPTLPFDRVLDYTKFAGFIPRAAFLRDPTLAVEAAIHSLEPRLPELRRALAQRQRLVIEDLCSVRRLHLLVLGCLQRVPRGRQRWVRYRAVHRARGSR